MDDKKEVPPAVGEFAIQERAKLLSDNVDLRARLAKYEDAEGRPLQRGGVVLSDEELWSIRNQVAIHQVLRDDDSVKICVKHGRAIEQAVLARLNSSPVSPACTVERPCIPCFSGSGKCAGGVDERAAFEAEFPTPDGVAWNGRTYAPTGNHSTAVFVSLCAVAARMDKMWEVWQARAALTASAPNHSEQVREDAERFNKLLGWMSSNVADGWNEVCRVSAVATYVSHDEARAYLDDLPQCSVGLAAAPSAGSQEQA